MFETAVVNKQSVFEPLKFYCMYKSHTLEVGSFMYTVELSMARTSLDP